MKIYDSQKKGLVEFKPMVDGKVSMYLCGPTVYDLPHLGHGRSAVCFDVIRRYFEYKAWDVNFVSNYTDIDDKMIKRANEEGISVKELADKVIPEYVVDYTALGIKESTSSPKATDHINEMVGMIEVLETKGHAYKLSDGMYFDVSTYEKYGEFSGQDLNALEMGSRVDINEEKKNPQDFALWKFAKDEEEYEDYWESPKDPNGVDVDRPKGRPGWHIECSAMSRAILGEKFDIHGGGLDLKFPHHECEVAQTKCSLGEDSFARHWMHNGFIQIDNEKMSKSLGNFFTLRDIFKKYDPVVVRFMFLQTRYRNPINFSDELLENAKARLWLYSQFWKLFNATSPVADESILIDDFKGRGRFDEFRLRFDEHMDNDFNTSGALGVVDEFMKEITELCNAGALTEKVASGARALLEKFDSVLGVIFHEIVEEEVEVPEEVTKLAEERKLARSNKDFEASDKLRDEIKDAGYLVEDTPEGFVLKKL